jgi:hypothetical protein
MDSLARKADNFTAICEPTVWKMWDETPYLKTRSVKVCYPIRATAHIREQRGVLNNSRMMVRGAKPTNSEEINVLQYHFVRHECHIQPHGIEVQTPRVFFLICLVGGGIKVHSTLRPLNGLLCQPRVIMIMEKIGGMIGRGNRSTRRKPAPELLCPPQTPHAAHTQTRAAAVGRQHLTAELWHGLHLQHTLCSVLL